MPWVSASRQLKVLTYLVDAVPRFMEITPDQTLGYYLPDDLVTTWVAWVHPDQVIESELWRDIVPSQACHWTSKALTPSELFRAEWCGKEFSGSWTLRYEQRREQHTGFEGRQFMFMSDEDVTRQQKRSISRTSSLEADPTRLHR
jgi:hypothetical protein